MRAITWIACMSLTMTACRFGFDELDGSDDDGGVIVTPPMPGIARVLVIGEDFTNEVGQPVANAYVIATEANGDTTMVRTAADGTASIEIRGNTSIHVARPLRVGEDGEWALSSFRAVNDGAYIIAGGRPRQAVTFDRTLTVDLPAFPIGHDEVWITGTTRCLPDTAWAMSTTVPVKFDAQCDGETVELFALAWDIYIPLGSVTLADGDMLDRTTATWIDLEKVAIDYENVPADVTDTYAFLAWPSGTDLVPMGENSAVPDMGSVGLVFGIPPIVPGTSMIHVFESPAGARAVFERIDSWPGTRVFDAAQLPPAPPLPTVDLAGAQVQWSSGSASVDADLYWVSNKITIDGRYVYWNAFGPPGATEVTFPVLPPELSRIVPSATSTWSSPRVVLAALSDFDYASALEIVDRDMFWWWSQGAYMPPGTVSMTATQLP